MSENTSTVVCETVSSEIEVLRAKEAELKAAQKALKEAQRLSEWETDVAAVNPAYVVGSVRKPTAEEVSSLGHSHGRVCEIRCTTCGEIRVVNLQDARQCRFCKECKKVADREKSKVTRTTKKLSGKSVETLEAQIVEAQKALEALRAAA